VRELGAGRIVSVRRLCIALLACALAGGAARAAGTANEPVTLAPSRFTVPKTIGPMRYNGETVYKDRRLGRSFGYNVSGISLNIYVYDNGLSGVPDGPDSIAACQQYESAKREIENGGNYQNVKLRREVARRMSASADGIVAREAEYEFDRHGNHAVSVLWLTVADGFFIKLRLSMRAEISDELEEARAQILSAIALSLAVQRSVSTVPPFDPSSDTSIEVDENVAPDETSVWVAYAAELLRLAREQPLLHPVCGGRLEPGIDAEVRAREAALREYRARPAAARTSVYFDELARVADAGFLDEYVWYYLRGKGADKVRPAELDKFESYRKLNLSKHVARTGAHVNFDAVRALPLASAP
jgi:hypothetical protein